MSSDEVLDERLDADAHAALAGGDGLVERFLAAQVDDVGRGAGQLGKRHQVVHALGLDGGRAALVVLAGVGLAGGEQFLAALGDQRLVFAVRGDDHAEFLRELERAVELGVVDAERALVGEEDFEGADAALTISRSWASVLSSNFVTPMWNVKSHADLPTACVIQSSNEARASSLRAGQHISMSVVVPPTSAALLPVS